MIRKYLVVAVALAALMGLPTGAQAANFCVGVSAACTDSPSPAFPMDTFGIDLAVSAANASGDPADNIFLAAGNYPLGLVYVPNFAAGQEVHLIGAGAGATVFTASTASGAQLTFNFKTATSDAKGFSLNVTGTPASAKGIQVFSGGISDFAVNQLGGNATNFNAVALDSGATAVRGSIAITSPSGVGLQLVDGGLPPEDGNGNASEISMTGVAGATGVSIDTATVPGRNLDRLRISGFSRGVLVNTGSFQLKNTLIDMKSTPGAHGISAWDGVGSSFINADVLHVTIVGTGNSQFALLIGAAAGEAFSGGFVDMVLFAAGTLGTAVSCDGTGAISATATIDSVAIRGANTNIGLCSMTQPNVTDLTLIDPGFRDFSGGDYRLKPNSPLVDHGKVGSPIALNELDLLGGNRLVDGDNNGAAVIDLGAFEYQRTPPTVTASATSSQVGAPIGFSAAGADADGEALSFAWSFDDGTSATGQATSHAFAAPGAHTATVTATDEAGLKASAAVTANVTPLPALPTARITAKPKKSFLRSKRGFAAPKKGKPFFAVKVADSARVKFTLKSIRAGKRKSVKGSQTLAVKTGTNKFGFGGKFGGKILKAGKYQVTVTPLAADGATGKPVTVNLTLK